MHASYGAVIDPAATAEEPRRGAGRRLNRASKRAIGAIAGVFALLALGAFGGYNIAKHQPSVTVLSGTDYSSGAQAEVTVDQWVYALPFDVQWQAPDGTWVQGTPPPCVKRAGKHPLTFGYVTVSVGSFSWRQVVWVSCP
jgi:hypothetical protein